MAQPQYFHWLPLVIHDLHLKLFNSDRFSPSQQLKEHFTQIMMLSHTQTIQLENKIKARREQKSRDHVQPDPNELSLQIIHCGIKLLMMFQTLSLTHTHTVQEERPSILPFASLLLAPWKPELGKTGAGLPRNDL